MTNQAQPDIERHILETEWKECRRTIRNFDSTLSWHRIYSIIAVGALLGIATDLFTKSNAFGAIIIAFATLLLIVIVFLLERHYRDFMLTAVDRAIRLEEELKRLYKDQGVDLGKITIHIGCKDTSAMISGVIKEKRSTYYYFKREAHILTYAFLFLACSLLLAYFLHALLF